MASVDSNTVLLVHSDYEGDASSTTFTDSSSNSHTITEYNNCAHTTSYQKFGTSSIAFDGADDYLEIADHASLDFGTGDFTIDLWFNIDEFADTPSGNYYHTLVSKGDYSQAGEWELAIQYNTGWEGYDTLISFHLGASYQLQDISTLTADTWYHLALVRSSGVITYYIDGVSQGTDNQAGTMNNTSPLWIGVSEKQPTYGDLNGRLDEIRLSDTARWSTNFSVPTAAYSSDANTVLLIHSNYYKTTFTDSGASANAPHTLAAAGDANHSTAEAKFGSSSIYFDGTDDSVDVTDAGDLDLGTGDFTIDFWVNMSSEQVQGMICRGDSQSINGDWTIYGAPGAPTTWYFVFEWRAGGAKNSFQVTLIPFSTGSWYHLAYVRESGTLKFYVDGVEKGDQSCTDALDSSSAIFLGAGRNKIHTYDFHGYLDEVRISNNARWTSNFTPPTAPYGGETVVLTSQALTLTQNAATVLINTDLSLTSQALTLTQNALSAIVISPTVATTSLPLTITQSPAEVFTDEFFAASALTLTLTQNAATVLFTAVVPVTSQALTLTQSTATVNIPVTVSLTSQALTLAQGSATTRQVNSAGHAQIITTGIKPLIETGGNKPIITTTVGG